MAKRMAPFVEEKSRSQAGKLHQDLAELKKSLDYKLITQEEYDEHKKEMEEKLNELPHEEDEHEPMIPKKSDRALIIILICILMVVGGAFFGMKFVKDKYRPLTIDELNELNVRGELKADQGYMYKGVYSFVLYDGLWYTQVQTKKGTTQFNIPLHYSPRDLEDIKLEGRLNTTLFNSSDIVYMTFHPLGEELKYVALSIGEFDQSLIKAFGKTPVAACTVNETLPCSTRPIINCTNTEKPVVYMKDDIETKAVLDDNCITAQGRGNEIVRATDRILLALYGIMN